MSKGAITRLSRYENALNRFRKLGFVRVFSDNISDAVGVTPSQVRKDFSVFGISGKRRGGYKIDELLKQINSILGKDKLYEVILVGAGNIGAALMKYSGFEKENMKITASFDIDPAKYGDKTPVPVYPLEQLRDYVSENDIKVGIIAVPEIAAQQVCDMMVNAGVKGILNFAPIMLRGDESITISNVNLGLELEKIIYYVNADEKAKEDES